MDAADKSSCGILWVIIREIHNNSKNSKNQTYNGLLTGIPKPLPSTPGTLSIRSLEQVNIPFHPGGVTCTPKGDLFVSENYGYQVTKPDFGSRYDYVLAPRPDEFNMSVPSSYVKYAENCQKPDSLLGYLPEGFETVSVPSNPGSPTSDGETADTCFVYKPNGFKVEVPSKSRAQITDIETADGYMLVVDKTAKSILYYPSSGTIYGTRVESLPVKFLGAAGISIHQNTIYLTSSIENTVYKLDWCKGGEQKIFVQNTGPGTTSPARRGLKPVPPKVTKEQNNNTSETANGTTEAADGTTEPPTGTAAATNDTSAKIPPAANTELRGPRFVASNNANVAVSCSVSKTVLMYDTEGTLKFSYTGEKSPKGELAEPWGVVIDPSGRLIISDFGKNCVHFVSGEGEFLGLVDVEKDGLTKPTALAINRKGQLVVAALWSKNLTTYEYSL